MRIVIAEDSVLLREGLTRLLADAGEEIVAAVGDADQATAVVDELLPDIVVMDVRMPPSHTDEGIRAALAIRRHHPEMAVLVLSQYVEQHYATELLAGDTAGVGYLLKDRVADVGDFIDAVRRVGEGGTALDPEVVSHLLARSRRKTPLERLTPRETEVLGEMARGKSNAAIAASLVLSERAVEKHTNSIFSKLGLSEERDLNRRVKAVLVYLHDRQDG
jgi:DNA-binding NarL/FixJ family response regulator